MSIVRWSIGKMATLGIGGQRAMAILALPLLACLGSGCEKKEAPHPAGPPAVEVMAVATTNLPIFTDWIGTLNGYVNADIRAQVTGYLQTQNYSEGSRVKTGDTLFQIDPRPFQAVLDQAEAKLAQDRAQQGETELNVKRYTPLAKEQAISQQELDDAVQANLAALAQIKADEAAIETAKLNLGFTKITSPVDGLAGLAQAQIGDLLSPSSGLLTTVSTLDPIKAFFQVSEQSYLDFWRPAATGEDGGTNLELQLVFPDNTVYPAKGHFFFADRNINPNTGTLQIVGLFPNPDYMLRPGQYCRIRVQTKMLTNAIVVPQRAVTETQGTYQVATVNGTNGVHIQPVDVGPQLDAGWVIEQGLKAGDRLVVEGTQKASKEGMLVDPKPFGEQPKQ